MFGDDPIELARDDGAQFFARDGKAKNRNYKR
jgi:hypothetical protein